MIKKLINKYKKKKEESYIDFTNSKSNKFDKYLGLKIITRPYKKIAIYSALVILLIAIITPFTNIFLFPSALWIIKRFG